MTKKNTTQPNPKPEPLKTAHGFTIPEQFRGRAVQFPYPEIGLVHFGKSPSKSTMSLLHKRRPGQFKKA